MDIEKVSPTESKFIFHNSTSTIGNLLQTELLRDPNVTFAGYSCPHPLETKMIVTVITSGKNPREVITNTFNNLVAKLDALDSAIKSLESPNQKD
jgi:DNA-directed RNA polymerase II subunit RPB11